MGGRGRGEEREKTGEKGIRRRNDVSYGRGGKGRKGREGWCDVKCPSRQKKKDNKKMEEIRDERKQKVKGREKE